MISYCYLKKRNKKSHQVIEACLTDEEQTEQHMEIEHSEESYLGINNINSINIEKYAKDEQKISNINPNLLTLSNFLFKELFYKKNKNFVNVCKRPSESEIDYTSSIKFEPDKEYHIDLFRTISGSVLENGSKIPVRFNANNLYIRERSFCQ